MSSMEEDDILMDPNGNQAVEIEATTSTTTGFFANILKKVIWLCLKNIELAITCCFNGKTFRFGHRERQSTS